MNPPTPPTADVLDRKRRTLVPCVYHFYQNPPLLVRGQGLYLYDTAGKAYLDLFSGVSVNVLGHGHPEVVAAIRQQAETLCHTTTIYLTEPMLELAEKMIAAATVAAGRVFFCADGSGANESAAALAQHLTGKSGLAAVDNSLHGNTRLTLSLTGIDFWKGGLADLPSVVHGPAPYCYRCPFDADPRTCDLACAAVLEERITGAAVPVGALFIEVVQANGGIVVPPPEWFARIEEIVARHDLLLVTDEVQTALGRTGRMFAGEHFNLHPDMITVAKAFGGGLPLGAVIAGEAVAAAFTRPRASTFGGNPVVCRAGCAVMDAVKKENLLENAETMGARLKDGLLRHKERHAGIGDVRGLGLMLGVELVGKGKAPDSERADGVLELMKDDGFLVGKAGQGRNVVVFMPPLIIGPDTVDAALDAFDRALARTRPGRVD